MLSTRDLSKNRFYFDLADDPETRMVSNIYDMWTHANSSNGGLDGYVSTDEIDITDGKWKNQNRSFHNDVHTDKQAYSPNVDKLVSNISMAFLGIDVLDEGYETAESTAIRNKLEEIVIELKELQDY